MLKEMLRIFGISLIISGITLYFIPFSQGDPSLQEKNNQLTLEITELEMKLNDTSKELANLQTTLNNTKKDSVEETEDTNDEEKINKESEAKTTFILQVKSGTTSRDVSTQLENATIIENAEMLNDYLKKEKLTTKIQIGQYQIDNTMSIESIAKLITTSQ